MRFISWFHDSSLPGPPRSAFRSRVGTHHHHSIDDIFLMKAIFDGLYC